MVIGVFWAVMLLLTAAEVRRQAQRALDLVPDGRDVLGPLSVECFCPLLQLVQLILDHLHSIAVTALFCHSLHPNKRNWSIKLPDTT